MKVMAINSSPRMDKGNTSQILAPFIEGMEESGADVKIFYTKKLKVNPCQGEFHCWRKTPGICFQDDDMEKLLPILNSAEILVLATPVYCDGVTGPMKTIMDRMIPMVQPIFELRDGHCRHPIRKGTHIRQIVLVSNCGLWEMDNFDPLLVHMKAFSKNVGAEFAGALLRPHGEAMVPMIKMGLSLDDILDAAREAGRQLIRDGEFSRETLNAVSRELIPKETYVERVNQGFKKALKDLHKNQ